MLNPLLSKPTPDFSRLVRTLRGEECPSQAPLVELFLDREILQALHQRFMGTPWIPVETSRARAVQQEIELYWQLGFDYFPINHWHNFLNQPHADMVKTQDTADLSRGERGYVMTGHGRVRSWADFERIPWERIVPDYSVYELAIPHLPEGMKIVTETTFFQNMVDVMFGYDGLCTLPEPELRRYVRAILEQCVPAGRYACGSGNSVANYVPLASYLILLEEARRT